MSNDGQNDKLPGRVVECTITPTPRRIGDSPPEVWALFDDGTAGLLFRYYPDEVSFEPSDFVGLTREEAHALFGRKDSAFLRRP